MKTFHVFSLMLSAFLLLTSCGTKKVLNANVVGYQSVRTRHAQPTPERPIPKSAEIAVVYTISETGEITAVVYNRTPNTMVIDQTKSFFVNADGKSTSYYDPTVRTTSSTSSSSITRGGSINLGALAGAFGVGGILGRIASGINLGGAGTTGTAITNATYVADQPQVSLAPHSNGAMSKVFSIIGIGKDALSEGEVLLPEIPEQQSYSHFSIYISYSLDDGKTFKQIATDFYANSKVIVPVRGRGRTNEALRQIYATKQNAINEYWWMLYFSNNIDKNNASIKAGHDFRVQGILFDYQ